MDCFEGADGTAAGGHDDGADVGVKVAQGRNARSEPLLVAGMSWFVMKTKP
jgi:hypothetical protein